MVKMQFASVAYSEFINAEKWLVNYFLLPRNKGEKLSYNLIKLGELVEERNESIDPQKYPDWPFGYIGLENIEPVTGFLNGFKPKAGKEIKSRSKLFYSGDLLYGKLRPTLNKVYKAEDNFKGGGICSTEFFVMKIKEEKIPVDVLRFLLASEYVVNQIKTFTAGAALPRISLSDFLNMDIPLPDEALVKKFEEQIAVLNKELLKARDFYADASSYYGKLFESVYSPSEKKHLSVGIAAEAKNTNAFEGKLPFDKKS